LSACDQPTDTGKKDDFVAVTGISGVATQVMAGIDLPLDGIVVPENATNTTKVWSVKADGNTAGGTIAPGTNTLATTQAGSVTVIATIANGTAQGKAYTQEFPITVSAAPVAVSAFNLTSLVTAPVTGAAPNVTGIDETQYTGTITWKTNTGAAHSGNFAASTVYQAEVSLTAKTGYTFADVAANSFTYTGATEVTHSAGAGTTLAVTITFPATVENITVTFDTNEGSAIASQTFASGGTATRPAANPTKTGYTFDNWYVEAELTTVFDFDNSVTANTTVYAKWTGITYSVAFNKNSDNASGSMSNQTHTYGTAQNLTANSFTRASHVFTGWNTQADGGGTAYTDSASVSNLASTEGATVTLYAQWQELTKLTSTGEIAAYLNGASGGASAADPIPLVMELALTETNWNDILTAINTANKFITLDLTGCTKSGVDTGGGLYSSGYFDPVYDTTTGKAKIVNLTLPTLAMGIVESSDYNNPTFKHFTELKTVSGAGVTYIGNYAFRAVSGIGGPAALTSASLPVASIISGYAFQGCAALTSVSLPAAFIIGSQAFYGCTALTSVTLSAPTTIGFQAFSGCAALTSVTMSKAITLENFNGAAFGRSNNQIVWTLTGETGDWTIEDNGKKLIYGGTTLAYYHAASGDLTLPGITAIGDYAFYDCTALTSVSLPQAASIGWYAFSGCAALTSVTLGASPPTLGTGILGDSNTARTVTVRIPASAKTGYGVPSLTAEGANNFDNDSTSDSWGNAFRGKGWNGESNYGRGDINTNITLVFQSY
jgi:uncharacterized repeat protein (TIGR02543 family)